MKWIPAMLSLSNLCCGVISIILAFSGLTSVAALVVLLGMLFDLLDGYAARKLLAESLFGKSLDSLCDIITFGAAPALLSYVVALHKLPFWGAAATGLFLICGALRLARFSIQKQQARGFVGMPITFAGGVLTVYALFAIHLHVILSVFVIILLSCLMVCTIRFPSLKVT
ncbi:CDP-diacylglycerol--serine O-phosphatidyltransferase [Paenibacillus sp. SYP-B3998]|uniref:CDP-diacylglycerol--serine O-phosphatidyltransferase n=1 Tax=Paenibacillus sp. SYP-B3998 TaxID=2678564 RepID=A0A6G4A027_9BACL|nr:CDP-diacylglycerol--serine O-phosphatidyltransferase [Paenibacillus sp. SYP-B3998]NEW07742.1 CDP-diacylglycerol--serine O-phosphatidyltransferase [Paenibacillus sp. SYP-B3998]